jgi:hypothetical protein
VLELHNLAIYLGVPLRMAPELLWLPSALLAADLPLGWYEAEAAAGSGGGTYYHCPSLGCVQWEHPAHAHLRGVALFLVEEIKEAARTEAAAAAAAAAAPVAADAAEAAA